MEAFSTILSTIFMKEESKNENWDENEDNHYNKPRVILQERFKLTALEMSKSRIMVYGSNCKELSNVLKLLLNRFSRLKDIRQYSTDVYTDNMPRIFQKVFIDEPGMYFTGFTKDRDIEAQSKMMTVHTRRGSIIPGEPSIFLTAKYQSIVDFYHDNDNCIIIYKIEGGIDLQNKFLFNILNPIVKTNHKEFISAINNQESDIEYIVIKDDVAYFM